MQQNIFIRNAEPGDLKAIINIYNQAVRAGNTTADLEEVTVESRKKWFAEHNKSSYPVYIASTESEITGWCSISAYRPGRGALKQTAEISYYVDYAFHGIGIGTRLINYAIADCKKIGVTNLFALLLDCNIKSTGLLEKAGFEKWGHMPAIADLNGKIAGHLIYGLHILA